MSSPIREQSLPLSVDWLSLTLRLKTRVGSAPAGHTWAFYTSTNVWASRWCLYNSYGEKVFTLLFQPRSEGFLDRDMGLLEVANEWLYHGIGITGVLGLLRESCDFDVLGISRLDLAVDFTPTPSQRQTILDLATQDCYIAGKRSGSGFWENIKDDKLSPDWQGRVPHCQSWGHKTSNIRWKLYYKTKELRDAAGKKGWSKPYIVDMWRDVGLDELNVWRLEVAIHHANQFNFLGRKLTFEDFMHSGTELFNSLYDSRFSVRRNEGHADKSNDTIVDFLPVGRCRQAFKCRRRDVIAEHNGSLSLLRHLVSDVMTENVLLNEPIREAVLSTIETMIGRDGLERYFRALVGDEFDSWREWVRVQAYYYGQENVREWKDNGEAMEQALLQSGLVQDHWSTPLGATSSSSQYIQQSIQFNYEQN